MPGPEKDTPARTIGRYVLFREVAHGGMATVHLGRLRGPAGFARTVAIKRLHPQYARDPEFVSMFLDEARLAARVQHPNVVSVLDVVAAEGELFLVMDYVHGEALGKLLRMAIDGGIPVTTRVIAAIASNVLDGLHAAHEARNERGDPLDIVHRDVSPQNVLVGVDGVARVLDFGIAKAAQRAHGTTREGQFKGKLPYTSPEQIGQGKVDRRSDVYAASVMLWEALTGKRLFPQVDFVQLAQMILTREHPAPSSIDPSVPKELDEVVLKGLSHDPDQRWQTAHEMAVAIEKASPLASAREVGEWVRRIAEAPLGQRATSLKEIENVALPERHSSAKITLNRVGSSAAPTEPPPDERDSRSPPPLTGSTMLAGIPRKRRKWILLGGAAALLAILLVVLAAASSGSDRKTTAAPPASAAASDSVATAAPAIPPPPQPDPSPTTSAEPSASTAIVAPPPPVVPRRPSPAVRPTRGSCNPPYTIDPNGVRIPKRQCL
jgi:serine/threonine-protein kinase